LRIQRSDTFLLYFKICVFTLAKVSNLVPTFFTVLNIFDEGRKVIMFEKPIKVGIFNKQLYAFQKYSFLYKVNIFIGLSVNMIF